jgi:hypothetical protein
LKLDLKTLRPLQNILKICLKKKVNVAFITGKKINKRKINKKYAMKENKEFDLLVFSIDRIDPNGHYEEGNIALCLNVINKMEFLQACYSILEYTKIIHSLPFRERYRKVLVVSLKVFSQHLRRYLWRPLYLPKRTTCSEAQ